MQINLDKIRNILVKISYFNLLQIKSYDCLKFQLWGRLKWCNLHGKKLKLSKSYELLCRLLKSKRIFNKANFVQKLLDIHFWVTLNRYRTDKTVSKIPKMATLNSILKDLSNDIYIIVLIKQYWFTTDFQSCEWTYDNIAKNHSNTLEMLEKKGYGEQKQ